MGAGMRGKPRVAMAWIGDGATSTGAFHEGLNFAAVQKIPLVVVAEDNKYAYSTPIAKQMAITRIDERAASYGIPHELVDGNDMLAVYDVAKRMVDTRPRRRRRAAHRRRHHAHAGARAARRCALRAEGVARRVGGEGSAGAVQEGPDRERKTATEKDFADIDKMTKEYAAKEADLAVDEPMPDPATVARGVYAGDDYAVPRVELVRPRSPKA